MSEDCPDDYEDDGKVSNDVINSVSQNCRNTKTEEEENKNYSIICWTGGKKKTPLVNFAVASVLVGAPRGEYEVIKQYHMTFKFVRTESKIVRKILGAHGYKEAHPHSNNFNLLWSGGHFRPYTIRGLSDFQKANHFPRSFELTRKDKLYRNIQRMQQCKGNRHFDFIPTFFVLPSERTEFHSAFLKDKGPWIVKPVASSRGRGIFLVKDANMVPTDEQLLVCRYIESPLLVNGFKFDCRIYVAVTSFDPLTVYMYKEGLARFSTVKYEKNFNNIRNLWMHLTNYSIQKNNENYVRCDDPDVDNFGSKWSFSALLRHLKSTGIDTKVLMGRIEDLIVKTMLSAEFSVGTACRMFIPYKNCCFELFGFDILIDESLKPWLLEVNLSPSLACESPLDLKIKLNLMTDLFNLTGFIAKDPVTVKSDKRRNSISSRGLPQGSFCEGAHIKESDFKGVKWEVKSNRMLLSVTYQPVLVMKAREAIPFMKQRYRSFSSSQTDLRSVSSSGDVRKAPNEGLSNEELRMIREAKEEYKRRGKFVRIYPTPESWELYTSIQEHSSGKNKILHAGLFPELWSSNQRPSSAKYIARGRSFVSTGVKINSDFMDKETAHGMLFQRRYLCYEKKLESWDQCLTDSTQASTSDIGPMEHSNEVGTYEERLLGKHRVTDSEFDLVKIIENGDSLSKFQAREAFASYLERVQSRLLQEISASAQKQTKISTAADVKQEEQMSLILRFLKRAAVNFRCPMAIISPSKSLPIQERQRMLVRQLKDFIEIYRKETSRLSDNEKLGERSQDESIRSQISNEAFHMFLTIASENELEELLSIFTRSNKAASIFLGDPGDAAKQTTEQSNANMKTTSSAKKSKENQASSHSTWKELLSKRESQLKPSLVKCNQPVPAGRPVGDRPMSEFKPRPVSANPLGNNDLHLLRSRPASAMTPSSQSSSKNIKSLESRKSKSKSAAPKYDPQATDGKMNNQIASRKSNNHIRHSSAPSQRILRSKLHNSDENNNNVMDLKQARVDADKTFDSFVTYGSPYMKDFNDDFVSLNEISRSKGTQTSEGHHGREGDYFKSREIKRIDANVKRAQRAHYETYLKELKNDAKSIVPHPPSQRPDIKKPVNTNRINRMMAKAKDKD